MQHAKSRARGLPAKVDHGLGLGQIQDLHRDRCGRGGAGGGGSDERVVEGEELEVGEGRLARLGEARDLDGEVAALGVPVAVEGMQGKREREEKRKKEKRRKEKRRE